MNYRVVEQGRKKYIECVPSVKCIENERDALELVVICGENETNRLMLHAENLTEDFYQLRTGVAGEILQKFATYFVKVAAVLSPELVNQGRFRDMVLEANRGRHFHVFYEHEKAEQWLISD
jgi:PadR family transcriptional regulator AphA